LLIVIVRKLTYVKLTYVVIV